MFNCLNGKVFKMMFLAVFYYNGLMVNMDFKVGQ
jgi:hypothetical protein